MSYRNSTTVSAKGWSLMTASWDLQTLADSTSLMGSVIYWVLFIESIRTRSSRSPQWIVEVGKD
ncbi:unnamed protein product [Prunus armeniaca]|uniref:Uncharacterized protein n=1 Tax=Prunus armeniaca TaxID=36596 RepID=A0A6J5TZP8_PRUAR|nr:unnamed protein product [Prunus armeniaca]CAB4299200.1 unnamed protein product [Prunus armeniaca]